MSLNLKDDLGILGNKTTQGVINKQKLVDDLGIFDVREKETVASERPSTLAVGARAVMGKIPTQQLRTGLALRENIPDVTPGEGFFSYQKKVAKSLQPRETEIAKRGTVAQFEDPIALGIAASGVKNPIATLEGIAKFGALEGLANVTGINKAIEGIKQPELRDVTDIAKVGAEGILSNLPWRKTAVDIGLKTGAIKPEKIIQDATKKYRNILKPTQGEVKNIEIRQGKNIDDYYKVAAEEGLVIKQTPDKKLDTTQARETLEPKIEQLQNELNTILLQDKSKRFDLTKIAQKAKREIKSSEKNAEDMEAKIQDVDSILGAEIRRYGRYVSAEIYNKIKQGMWSKGYNQLKPTSKVTARKIGHIIKEDIETAYPNEKIRVLNEKSGQYATLIDLLENAQGRVIQGGRLGRYLAQGLGAVGLSKIPVAGPMVGAWLGGKLADYMRNPERISSRAAKQASQSKKYDLSLRGKQTSALTPEIVEELPINKQKFLPSRLVESKRLESVPFRALPLSENIYGQGFSARKATFQDYIGMVKNMKALKEKSRIQNLTLTEKMKLEEGNRMLKELWREIYGE